MRDGRAADFVVERRILPTWKPAQNLVYIECEVQGLLIDYIKNIHKERFCYGSRTSLVVMSVNGEGMQVPLSRFQFLKTVHTNQIQALTKRLGDMAQKILIGERSAVF